MTVPQSLGQANRQRHEDRQRLEYREREMKKGSERLRMGLSAKETANGWNYENVSDLIFKSCLEAMMMTGKMTFKITICWCVRVLSGSK
jgi:hypothetical protein